MNNDPDRWADAAMQPDIERRLAPWLTNGHALHPMTINLVVRFARALAAKLAEAEVKYGYSDGWRSPDWMDECRANLIGHIAKGDPRDVAAYCAFLWHHGESTAKAEPTTTDMVQATAQRLTELANLAGLVVTIERRPLLPLAMGHAAYVIETRPARGGQ